LQAFYYAPSPLRSRPQGVPAEGSGFGGPAGSSAAILESSSAAVLAARCTGTSSPVRSVERCEVSKDQSDSMTATGVGEDFELRLPGQPHESCVDSMATLAKGKRSNWTLACSR